MKITHRMTVSDKLIEIMRVKKWNQKALAGKLGVSQKTVSFWINNKKRPSILHEQKIEELYNSLMKTAVSADVPEELIDFQVHAEFDETEKSFSIDEKDYYDAKCYVIAKEKGNNRYIYLYPSIGSEVDGWYKVGGRSLLFYKCVLAPRLKREARLRDDTDKSYRFTHGIASVRWGNKLMEEAVRLGYEASRVQYGIIVIDLKKEFTDSEIKEMNEAIRVEKNRVKTIIKPKNNYPKLMVAMNKLVQVLPSKVKKLDASYRHILGKELLQPMAELLKIYFRFANGRMEKRDAKIEMLEGVDDLSAMIYLMDEAGMLNLTARTRMGENVVSIRNAIEEIE